MIRLKHLPLDNIEINSPYGPRSITVNGRYFWWHNGLDLNAQVNTPVYAVADGKVRVARYDNSYGYYLALDHGNYGTLYSHLSRYIVTEGNTIRAGEIIAYSGSTGDVTGPHLHFEMRLGTYDKFWERANCDSSVFMNTIDPKMFIDDYIEIQRDLSVDESINIVQSAAGLEDKTMDYMAKHYRFGDDLVKKLARAIIKP
jgi:murein DD-endopeptidase MepM/ murein hydrolase activator NlpD